MNKNTSPRNLQLLSDYLDRQLTPRQEAHLASRLRQEPDLQQTLNELRHTQRLLRGLPQKRAPRNFFLTPEMVPAAKPVWLAPSLGFASALATFLLICVFVLQGMGFLGRQTVSVQPSQEEIALEVEKILMATLAQEEAMKALTFPTGTPEPIIEVMAVEQPATEEIVEAVPESLQADTPDVSPEEGEMPLADQAISKADLPAEEDFPPAIAADLPVIEMQPMLLATSTAPDVAILRTMTQTQSITVAVEGPSPELFIELEETQSVEEESASNATEIADFLPTVVRETPEDASYTLSYPEPSLPWLLILKIGLISLALLTGGLAILFTRRK